jgi:hypothetical protein
MPALEGRYEMKMSTIYGSSEEGIKEIVSKIGKSKIILINTIPKTLLMRLSPHMKGKAVKVILPVTEIPDEEIKKIGDIAVSKARVYKDYKGIEADTGAIYFADKVYSIIWVKDRILEIETMEYDRCVKCMKEMFETVWKMSRK